MGQFSAEISSFPGSFLGGNQHTTFLRTDDGEPFVIVESLSGYRLVNDDKPDQRIPEDMRFVCMDEIADGDAFVLKGYMAYHGILFGVSMCVLKNGYVEMLR